MRVAPRGGDKNDTHEQALPMQDSMILGKTLVCLLAMLLTGVIADVAYLAYGILSEDESNLAVDARSTGEVVDRELSKDSSSTRKRNVLSPKPLPHKTPVVAPRLVSKPNLPDADVPALPKDAKAPMKRKVEIQVPPKPLPVRTEGAIWISGKLDGKPIPAGGYGQSANQAVVTVKPNDECPESIHPSQTICLELPRIPQEDLVLQLVLNSSKQDSTHPRPWLKSKKTKYLEVFYNGEKLYARWMRDSACWISIYLPRVLWQQGRNELTIINRTDRTWGIDSVWIERPKAAPRWITLEGAEKQGASKASLVPMMTFTYDDFIPCPTDEQLLSLGREPPFEEMSLRTRQLLWQKEGWAKRRLPQPFHSPVVEKQYRRWQQSLGRILMRGAEPVCRVQVIRAKHQNWYPFFLLFGRFVKYWQLDCQDKTYLDQLIAVMKAKHPTASIGVSFRGRTTLSENVLRSASLTLPALSQHTVSQNLCEFRRACLGKGFSCPSVIVPRLDCLRLLGVESFDDRCRWSEGMAEIVTTWFHAGGGGIMLANGGEDSGLFPSTSPSARPLWDMISKLLPIGRNNARGIPCNVIALSQKGGLHDCSWFAVKDSKQRCAIVVFGGADKGRSVRIQCPVQWSGAGVLEGDRMVLSPTAKPKCEKLQPKNVNVPGSKGQGILDYEMKLSSLAVIRLRQQHTSPSRQNVLSAIPPSEARPATDLYLLRPHDQRFVQGEWRQSLLSYDPFRDCTVLWPGVSCRKVAATPGLVGKDRDTVPWESESLKLSFPKSSKSRSAAVKLFLRLSEFDSATHIELWLRAEGIRHKRVRFRLGTLKRCGEASLQSGRWTCLRMSVAALLKGRKRESFYLYVWPPETKTSETALEINAIHAVGTRVGKSSLSNKARLLRLEEEPNKVCFVLVAASGKPAMQHLVLPGAIVPNRITSPFADLICQYDKGSRVLSVAARQMPQKSFPKPESIRGLPENLRKSLLRGGMSAIQVFLWRSD